MYGQWEKEDLQTVSRTVTQAGLGFRKTPQSAVRGAGEVAGGQVEQREREVDSGGRKNSLEAIALVLLNRVRPKPGGDTESDG